MTDKTIAYFFEDIAFGPQPIESEAENAVWDKPKHYEIKDTEGEENKTNR